VPGDVSHGQRVSSVRQSEAIFQLVIRSRGPGLGSRGGHRTGVPRRGKCQAAGARRTIVKSRSSKRRRSQQHVAVAAGQALAARLERFQAEQALGLDPGDYRFAQRKRLKAKDQSPVPIQSEPTWLWRCYSVGSDCSEIDSHTATTIMIAVVRIDSISGDSSLANQASTPSAMIPAPCES
jgi:hypothetical protein